jgi:membrane protein DedA with SNARE-associated domain
MIESTQFLVEHGVVVLFGVVLLEQVGLPLPAMPWLVAAGALAGSGKLDPVLAVGVTMLACLAADSAWFYAGRRHGTRVLGLICRVSLEPDCCVRRSEAFLARHAGKGLVAAKFLPGFGMVMPPLAASLGMSYGRFLIFDGFGSLLYSSCAILLGFVFSEQLQQLLALLGGPGLGALSLVVTLVSGYFVFKITKWRRNKRLRQVKESESALTNRQQAQVKNSVARARANKLFSEAIQESEPRTEAGTNEPAHVSPALASAEALRWT